jgi:hypothetical protein
LPVPAPLLFAAELPLDPLSPPQPASIPVAITALKASAAALFMLFFIVASLNEYM